MIVDLWYPRLSQYKTHSFVCCASAPRHCHDTLSSDQGDGLTPSQCFGKPGVKLPEMIFSARFFRVLTPPLGSASPPNDLCAACCEIIQAYDIPIGKYEISA